MILKKKIPVWFMRQAGRYLPEYREISRTNSFFKMSENPEIASKITIQPIKRFDFDFAIIFSDILTLPKALGCNIDIKKEVGPVIENINSADIFNFELFDKNIQSTLDAVKLTKENLDKTKDLIGFAGGPWTVALYLIEGRWNKAFLNTRKLINQNKKEFKKIIDKITDATIYYLNKKLEYGADLVQIFESFASIASFKEFKEFIIEPTKKIVEGVNGRVIGFPKGCGASYLDYLNGTGVDCLGLDYSVSLDWIKDNLQKKVTVQGNLDPYLLAFDKKGAVDQTKKILNVLGNKPFIFNLGHGIFKETPIENVEAVLNQIRDFR